MYYKLNEEANCIERFSDNDSYLGQVGYVNTTEDWMRVLHRVFNEGKTVKATEIKDVLGIR